MSEPLWCDVRGHYCRCHDFGKRCEDYAAEPVAKLHEELNLGEKLATPPPQPGAAKESQ